MPKRKDHYAILVAINRYPELGRLEGPENDAREFQEWLLDEGGGNVDGDNIKVICSADFPDVTEADDASPTEKEFKKSLNRWLRQGKTFRSGKFGERLYLFFAGHGFTAGTNVDPAIFTAQAQLGDTAHIAAHRYARIIQRAGFFDEIVLVMDCCQDVLKASRVGEPTWSPPDLNHIGKWMTAFGAQRGCKAYETPPGTVPAHGYFSSVFMKALRTAPADSTGNVSARAVQDWFEVLWERQYLKSTGYMPPIEGPRNLILYHRSPIGTGPTPPGPEGPSPRRPPAPVGPGPVDPVDSRVGTVAGQDALSSEHDNVTPSMTRLIATTISSQEPGAQVRVMESGRGTVAEGIGQLEVKLPVGNYTAHFRIGDQALERDFTLDLDDKNVHIQDGLLEFSSPIPLENTSTTHEYHNAPARMLGDAAASRANRTDSSFGTLLVFARDSTHHESTYWRMPPEVREGLRLRKLDEETGEPRIVPCEVQVDPRRGIASMLLTDLAPGTYLLGVRRLQRENWFWIEMALTVVSSLWRTEVYLDALEDDRTGRRFDLENASVSVVPGKGRGSLYGSEARLTEAARLALAEGRLGVDENLLHGIRDMGLPTPMLALYTAYALTLSDAPDVDSVYKLCRQLTEQWTERSADIKLLERWCYARGVKAATSDRNEIRPDEVPMVALGWELSRRLGNQGKLGLAVQHYIGAWRTCGSLWTHMSTPEGAVDVRPLEEPSTRTLLVGNDSTPNMEAMALVLAKADPLHSPLQQALRRAIIDDIESDEPIGVAAAIAGVGFASGLDGGVVEFSLNGLFSHPREGTVVRGVVRRLADYGAWVDIGTMEGLLHVTNMAWKRVDDPAEVVKVGDVLDLRVLMYNSEHGRLSLGLKQMSVDPWEDVARRYPTGGRLFGRITSVTDYGAFVEIEPGVEGLILVSEIDWVNKNIKPSDMLRVDDEVQVMVLDVDEERHRISLSMKQCQTNPWETFAVVHQEGDKVSGRITLITDDVVVVGLDGGIDGHILVSDSSLEATRKELARKHKAGDTLEVAVLAMDPEHERISLGFKLLEQESVGQFMAAHPRGNILRGTVKEVDARGATIDLGYGVEGYIRASDIAKERVNDASEHLKVGDAIEAMLIGLDREGRLLQLSIRVLQEAVVQQAIEDRLRSAHLALHQGLYKESSE